MPIIVDISEDYRFLEGVEKRLKLAANKRNTAFVKYLLQYTNHSLDQVASLVNVPVEFVLGVKNSLKTN